MKCKCDHVRLSVRCLNFSTVELNMLYRGKQIAVLLTVLCEGSKKGNVLFNDALNTFYLPLYGIGHMVKDHSDSERENPLPPHGLLFPINSKDSFICTIPQTG